MSKIAKLLIFLLFFLFFFEAGLISSYTIVTSEPPDIGELIDFQYEKIAGFFSFDVKEVVIGDAKEYNVTNPFETSEALKNSTKIDGVQLSTLKASTYEDMGSEEVNVNITTMAFSPLNKTSKATSFVLSSVADYKIVARAKGKPTSSGIEIDPTTVTVISISKVYVTNDNNRKEF